MGHYSQVLTQLGHLCYTRNFSLKELGRLNNKEQFPFVSVTINDNVELPTIVYSAGIHGNEIAPVHAILRFLQEIDAEKHKSFRFVIFPTVNPTGFDGQRRKNYCGLDLNSCFQRKELPEECGFMVDEISRIKNLVFYGAFHEDLYSKGKYYLFNFEKKPEKIYSDLLVVAKSFIPVATGLFNTGEAIARDGKITNNFDRSIESRVYLERQCLSICSETPSVFPLKTRIQCNLLLMKSIPHLLASELKC